MCQKDDLISRASAIDIVRFECGEWEGLAKTIIKRFEQLPSAQPEQRWIPCNERLPENGYWLWSAKGGEVQKDFYWDGHWEQAEKYGYEVVAWLPLPKPYKEGDYD